MDCELAFENIDLFNHSDGLINVDDQGRLSQVSWYNFPLRFYLWLQPKDDKIEQAVIDSFAALKKSCAEKPRFSFYHESFSAVADASNSERVRRAAFQALMAATPKNENSFFQECPPEKVQVVEDIPTDQQQELEKWMPINYAVVFVYDFLKKEYAVLQTPQSSNSIFPEKQLCKGESFFAAARKKINELGMVACPMQQAVIFSRYDIKHVDGEEVTTHTLGRLVFSLCAKDVETKSDPNIKWVSIFESPTDSVLRHVHYVAVKCLFDQEFISEDEMNSFYETNVQKK